MKSIYLVDSDVDNNKLINLKKCMTYYVLAKYKYWSIFQNILYNNSRNENDVLDISWATSWENLSSGFGTW